MHTSMYICVHMIIYMNIYIHEHMQKQTHLMKYMLQNKKKYHYV